MLKALPPKMFAKVDSENEVISTEELDFFDDGDEIGVYKLMSVRKVSKKVTLHNNGIKPKEKK